MQEIIENRCEFKANCSKGSDSAMGSLANVISSFGFMVIAVSTFLKFVPIVDKTWISMGIGFPVMLTALLGAILVSFKKHFAAFFAVMFPAFFITHGIIIAYDSKAISLGAVSGAEGWMRSIPMIFVDAMVPSSGAFWGLIGVAVAFSALTIGWILKIVNSNMELARQAELEYVNGETGDECLNEDEQVFIVEEIDDEESFKEEY